MDWLRWSEDLKEERELTASDFTLTRQESISSQIQLGRGLRLKLASRQ